MEKSLSDLEIKTTFIDEDDLLKIIYKYKAKIDIEIETCENQIEKNKIAKSYQQKLFTSLNVALRRQIILSTEEAIKFYSSNDDILEERINVFFDLIQKIQDDLNMEFIPDRLFICSFFRISAETYNILLLDPRADISRNLKNQIHNLEEFIIAMTTNGLEQGLISGYAWRKMQLKGEFGGNEIKPVETFSSKNAQLVITTRDDVQKRMGTNYNFPELMDNKKDNN